MKLTTTALVVLGLIFATTWVFAQDEVETPVATPTDESAPAAEESAAAVADDAAAVDAAALEALMGETEEPAVDEGASGTAGETGGAAGVASQRPVSRRPSAPPPRDSVPEVPSVPTETVVIGETSAAGETAEDSADADAGMMETFAPPLGDYRAPEAEATEAPLGAEEANALLADPAPAPAPSSAPTVIIIGLIALGVLLVALAAVVGVMASQRSEPTAAPGAAGHTWAYLTAPDAPNISLQKAPFLIGSSPSSDLRLADPKASPEHARIDRSSAGYVLTDLGSANGTLLNGERIGSPVTLRSGDEIRMGDIVVSFEIQE